MVDEIALRPIVDRLLRSRIGFAPSPWPKALRRAIERLAQARGVAPEVLLARAEASPDPELTRALIGAATIPHTRFFRHPSQLERLGDELVALGRPARIWSAGCATGEEPYSLALLARARGVPVRVLATDVNEEVLEHAKRGVYPAHAVRRAGLDAPADGEWRVPDAIRAVVRFEQASIAGARPEHGEGPFDFVLCRNVLLYFDADEATRVVARLLRYVRPGGALVLAPVEVLRKLPDGVHRADPLGWIEPRPPRPRLPTEPPPPPAPEYAPAEDRLTEAARALGLGALDDAEGALRAVLDATPAHAVAWFLLGEVLLARDERTQAGLAFGKAAEHASADEEGQTLARAARRRRFAIDDDSVPP